MKYGLQHDLLAKPKGFCFVHLWKCTGHCIVEFSALCDLGFMFQLCVI